MFLDKRKTDEKTLEVVAEETRAKESAQKDSTDFFSKNDYSFDSLQKL